MIKTKKWAVIAIVMIFGAVADCRAEDVTDSRSSSLQGQSIVTNCVVLVDGGTSAPSGPLGTAVAVKTPPGWLAGLIAVGTPMVIALVKGFITPEFVARWKHWIPVVAPLVGELLNLLAGLFGLGAPAGSGALAGLAGVGVRELAVQQALKRLEGNFAALLLMMGGLALLGILGSGCALGSYTTLQTTGTNSVKTTYRTLTWYRDDKLKGLKVGNETKTTKTGLSIGNAESNTDEAAIAATGDLAERVARGVSEGVARGVSEGVVRGAVPVPKP